MSKQNTKKLLEQRQQSHNLDLVEVVRSSFDKKTKDKPNATTKVTLRASRLKNLNNSLSPKSNAKANHVEKQSKIQKQARIEGSLQNDSETVSRQHYLSKGKPTLLLEETDSNKLHPKPNVKSGTLSLSKTASHHLEISAENTTSFQNLKHVRFSEKKETESPIKDYA